MLGFGFIYFDGLLLEGKSMWMWFVVDGEYSYSPFAVDVEPTTHYAMILFANLLKEFIAQGFNKRIMLGGGV